MTMTSDLPKDLIEEILSRVPLTSRGTVRYTCKGWNVLFNDQSFTIKHCAKAPAKELMAIMVYNSRPCLTIVNLHNQENLVKPSPKEIGEVEISKVFHCDGLLVCVPSDNTRGLQVWNPYLGQVRWIQPINHIVDRLYRYAIGYDNNNNQKISRIFYNHIINNDVMRITLECEIYDLKSDSWKVFGGTHNLYLQYHCNGISLKGNTYFAALDLSEAYIEGFLLCLDFTQEKFGPRLHFPVKSYSNDVLVLSTVREEQLALLFQREETDEIEIWITTKIEPNAVSWRFFLKVDMKLPIGGFWSENGTFFVEEKQKVVVCLGTDLNDLSCNKAYVIGDGYYKEMDLGKSVSRPNGCSYVPSSVQIQGLLRSSRYLNKSRG